MTIQLKVQIKGITKPPVWRRFAVPAEISFTMLHEVIQQAFGWESSHLFSFSPSGYGSYPEIQMADEFGFGDDDEEDSLNADEVEITELLKNKGDKCVYIYDFGDDWIHQITVEEVNELDKSKSATLLGGKGACPPEDCGGPYAYEQLKLFTKDKNDPEYKDFADWMGLEEEAKKGLPLWDENDYDIESEKAIFDRMFHME